MKLRRKRRNRSASGIADQLRPRARAQVRAVEPEPEPGAEDVSEIRDFEPEAPVNGKPSRRERREQRRFRQTRPDPDSKKDPDGRAAGIRPGTDPGTEASPRLIIKGAEGEAIAAIATRVKVSPRPMKPKPVDRTTTAKPRPDPGPSPEILHTNRKKGGKHLAKRSHDVAIEKIAGAPAKERETEWSGEKPRTNWRWAAAITLGMTATVVGGLVAIEAIGRVQSDEGIRSTQKLGIEVVREEFDDQSGFLTRTPEELIDEATGLLARYGSARTPEDAEATIRDSQKSADGFRRHWTPWASRPLLERRELLNYAVTSDADPPFMVLWGLRTDFSPFRAYFIRENGHLRIDWEATEMVSGIPIGKLRKTAPEHPVLVRGLLKQAPFYTASLPEDRYQSYLIENPVTHEFLWGYAERNSETERKLQAGLAFRTAFLEHKETQRVIVNLTLPERRQTASQFLITEMLHIEWILP